MSLSHAILGASAAAAAWRLSRAASPSLELAGKAVYITGGSRGLGLELARSFGKRGARLALVARDADELATARAELEGRGYEVVVHAADVSDAEEAKAAVCNAVLRLGHIDVVVNCAGEISVGPFESMTLEDLREGLRGNFWGAANTIDAVLPEMRTRSGGRIVNISSIGGLVGVPHLAPYVTGKFALTGYSLTLRAELAQHGIKVVTVCPGLLRTGSPRNASFKGDAKAEYAWFRLGDSLPLLSMNAAAAAERIVEATTDGRARLILTTQAKLAAFLEAVWPDGATLAAAWANRLLPHGKSNEVARGRDLPDILPPVVTALDDAAAGRNNELRAT
jgi:NAD(P)-dependent dehydrogenase (short-subunit alcohol dehydrogenase family)